MPYINEMNEYQKQLYANLMVLASDPVLESFYKQDHEHDGVHYRVFLYRIASYSEFLLPGALESRGITFRLDGNPIDPETGQRVEVQPVELSSMPMHKFFNLNENPFTMDLDLSTIVGIMDKLDGSLISTVRGASPEAWFLKSKGSLSSEQAFAATRLLLTAEYKELHDFCRRMAATAKTVNMEYMAPDNRIVVGYAKPTLKVLNVRCNRTGNYIQPVNWILSDEFRVAYHAIPGEDEAAAWVDSVYKSEEKIEGFCVQLFDGTWFKIKTDAYCLLHKTKDSILVPRLLFEAIVGGQGDDLISLYPDDEGALSLITAMTEKVRGIYNHLAATVDGFYEANKGLDRKDYALAGQANAEVMKQGAFGLVMNLYIGKEANYEEFMVKHYKQYGIKDVAPEATAD